jgi:YbbR domain-containing protein
MRIRFGTLLLAWLIAMLLWGMAHGTSSIERGFDIPVVFDDIPENLVVTAQTGDVVNVRVLGSRAALRDVNSSRMEYAIDVSGAKPGEAVFEVDASRLELPRGARIVSRSPASIEVVFERRGRKSVRVRPDLEGEPAEGYTIDRVEVDPPRVWLTGARSHVLRLSEVVTETINVEGATEPLEKKVRLSLGSDLVWREEQGPVTVRVVVKAAAGPESLPPVQAGPEGEAPGTGATESAKERVRGGA